MEVPLHWYNFKNHLGSWIVQATHVLHSDTSRDLINRGFYYALQDFYNVGHPNRWPRTFPQVFNLSTTEQYIPTDNPLGPDIRLTTPINDLLHQVASHIDRWRLGIPNDEKIEDVDKSDLDERTKEIVGGLQVLAEITGDRNANIGIRRRFADAPSHEVTSLIVF